MSRRAATACHVRPPARMRHGMTLIEVLIALVILATVLVGLCEYMGRFARQINVTSVQATAADLVVSRLELVKGVSRYGRVDGFAGTEASIAGFAGFGRVTTVTRVSDASTDHKIVTVSVTHPILGADTVKKTTVVARF